MKNILRFLSILSILASVVLVVHFRTIPMGKLWENYIVLYVPTETDNEIVLNTLDNYEVENIVSLSGQYLPLNISEDSLEYIMYESTIDSKENEYINNRKSYFFDKSNRYRLYYIPKEYEKNVHKSFVSFKENNIQCGLDTNSTYPVLYPAVILFVAFLFFLFCKNRKLFFFSSLIPVVYVFCNPFFPVALSICLIILCIFFICNIWKRKEAFSYLSSYVFVPICFVVAALCGFSSSLNTGIFFLVSIAGVINVMVTYSWIQNYYRNRKPFIPVYIRPAKMVSLCSNKFKTTFTIAFGSGLLLLAVFTFTSSGKFINKSAKVLLPGATEERAAELPQLKDYYKWTWNIQTYPYKSLNSDSDDEFEISFPKYSSENGIITMTEDVLKYDEEYQDTVFNNINDLNFNSIESVLKSEGKDFIGGYTSSNSYHIDLFGIIMIIICYSILLFIFFSIIIRSVRKGTKK